MFAIYKKEIQSFFSSPTAYLVIGLFLVVNGLFLWVFKGDFNIIDSGFADLTPYFRFAPWILIFLIPAVTMKSIADEKKGGTLEILLTKPISSFQIVFGKFMGSFTLVVMALIPTLLYVYSVYALGNPAGNLDMGSTAGSYFGLLFLVASYSAIGIFASALTDNQIIAFMIAILLCFLFYFGFNGFSTLSGGLEFLDNLSMKSHFDSMSRGVLDLKDIVYFISICIFFLTLTAALLRKK